LSFSKFIGALWLPLMPLIAVFLLPLGLYFNDFKIPSTIPVLIPVAGGAISMLLGWRFHKSRAVFVAAILLIAYMFFSKTVELSALAGLQTKAVAQLIILLLPLNMLVYALLPERSLFNRYGFILALLLIVQAGLCYWLVIDQQSGALEVLINATDYRFLPVTMQSTPILPDILICLYAILLLLSIGRMALSGHVLEGGVFVASLVLGISSHLYMSDVGIDYFLMAAILAILLAVIQDSYRMAFIDELTSIPGRRALMNGLNSQGRRYAVAMSDIDHFKKFNDTHGHDVGDEVLRMVASKLNRVKGGGRAYRYGGEEFTIIFPGKTAEDAMPYLDDVRTVIEESSFSLRGGDRPKDKGKKQRGKTNRKNQVSVTISIGVADSETNGRASDVVMKAADKALYRAKKSGRNKVVK